MGQQADVEGGKADVKWGQVGVKEGHYPSQKAQLANGGGMIITPTWTESVGQCLLGSERLPVD